jgi:hypothetical protein
VRGPYRQSDIADVVHDKGFDIPVWRFNIFRKVRCDLIQLLFLSIDSFLAASALGALAPNCSGRRALCLAFGLCDGAASFAGLHFRLAPFVARTNQTVPLIAMTYFWVFFVAFLTLRITAKGKMSVIELSLLPLLLSVDNLFGTSLASEIATHTIVVPCFTGILSGVLAFMGYQAGSLFAGRIPSKWAVGVSSGLLLLLPVLS